MHALHVQFGDALLVAFQSKDIQKINHIKPDAAEKKKPGLISMFTRI